MSNRRRRFIQKKEVLSDKKYVLCIPNGGFNDQLSQIELCYKYCELFNRVLMINTEDSIYRISFDEYFYFKNNKVEIIYNSKLIKEIVEKNKFSINHGNNKNNYGQSFLSFSSFSGHEQDFIIELLYKKFVLIISHEVFNLCFSIFVKRK